MFFGKKSCEREHLHCGNSVSSYVQLGFFGASCRFSWVSVLFSTFFCLFSFWEKNDLFHSAVLQCEELGATVDVRVCVCAFVGETEPVCSDSITHAGSHCGTLTWTSWNTGKKGNNTAGSVGGPPSFVRAAHEKWNWTLKTPNEWTKSWFLVDGSPYDNSNTRMCVCVCVQWPLCSCNLHVHAVQNKTGSSKPVTTG